MSSVENYRKKITDLNNRFFLILEKYVKMYPMSALNPEFKQYSNAMAQYEGQLMELQRDLLMTKNNLENQINKSDEMIKSVDKSITEVRKSNKKLEKNLNQLRSGAAGAKGLIHEEKELYNTALLRLIFLLGGSVFMVLVSVASLEKSGELLKTFMPLLGGVV